MKRYKQLTQEQRYQIYAFLKAGFSQSAISVEIGVHKSTVSRELIRNRGIALNRLTRWLLAGDDQLRNVSG